MDDPNEIATWPFLLQKQDELIAGLKQELAAYKRLVDSHVNVAASNEKIIMIQRQQLDVVEQLVEAQKIEIKALEEALSTYQGKRN